MDSVDYIQDPPFAIQIELVEGCNLYCDFCGLRGIREKPNSHLNFMAPGLAELIAKEIARVKWTARIEFAMHGEPSLHNDLVFITQVFRKHLPKNQLMLTSNGGGFVQREHPDQYLRQVLHAGMNIVALDKYEGINLVDKLLASISASSFEYPIYRYPEHLLGNPHRRVKKKEQFVTVIQDPSTAAKGTHSLLNNHAGCAAPPDESQQGKRCAKPFRELSIRWNGNVALCCNDWRGRYKVSSVQTQQIDALWGSDPFMAARQRLVNGQRTFGPCAGCNAVSYRTGLLPDKFGKKSLPVWPEERILGTIQHATEGAPYSDLIVLRPWETPAP